MMKQLTINDIIPGGENYHKFTPDLPINIKVFPQFFILCHRTRIECRDLDFKIRWEISLSTLSKVLNKKLNEFPSLYFAEDEMAIFIFDNEVYSLLLCSGEISLFGEISSEAENLTFHPTSLSIAYTINNQIWIKHPKEAPFLLYEETEKGISINKIPSRDEFGISETLFWSPDGKKLAFYRVDEKSVSSYPIVNIKDPIAELQMIKYPMAGNASEKVTLGISQLLDKNTIIINSENETGSNFNHHESYKTCVKWSPDSQFLYLVELQRDQQKYELKFYNPHTGQLEKILYTEENSRYVEPQHKIHFTNDGQLIFQSRRDNFNHLYLLNINNGSVHQLTFGDWEVTKLIGIKEDEIYFQATLPTPIDRTLYTVNYKDKQHPIRPLYTKKGTTEITIHPQAQYSIATHHSSKNSGQLLFLNEKETIIKELLQLENPFTDYNLPQQEVGTITIGKDEVYYRITYPNDYNQKDNWPLVYYLYGGPHVQLIRNEWGSGTKGFEEMMALKGYVTFCIDPHGSDNRGVQFESAIWRNIGAVQTDDYIYALDWLLQREYKINSQKIALYGWSFGGFMTTRLLLSYPERFQVGVAGGAVIDWRYYEVMYTERYMQKPEENPEGYNNNSLINLLSDQIKENQLYLIHCDNDPVVLWQHTLSFIKVCNQKGIDVDYYVFPGHKHNVIGPERVHLMQKVANKIDQCLSPSRQ